MTKKDLYFFGRSGIGDDLMVVWAYLGAVSAGLAEPGKSFYFSNQTSSEFIGFLSSEFTEIKLGRPMPGEYSIVACRGIGLKKFKSKPGAGDFQPTFSSKLPIRFSGYHREASIYKGRTKFAGLINLLRKAGIFYAWDAGFPAIYTGWQELCVAFCRSKKECETDFPRLASAYSPLRERVRKLVSASGTNNQIILFPSSASPQNFDEELTELFKTGLGVRVARFSGDSKPADIYYPDLKSAALIMAAARGVITNDSSASHIAQFFAKKHLVLCSRARPGNVVFPGAESQILDLGGELACRPCHYSHGQGPDCAAGYRVCKALDNIDKQTIDRIKDRIHSW